MLPEGWKEVFIKDISNNTMGYAFKSKDFTKSGIQLLRMGNLYKNKLDLGRDPVFLPNTYSNEYEKFLVKKNDLVLSMTGTMGKRDYGFVVKLPKNCNPLLLNQRVMRISPNNHTFTEYLYQLLISEKFLSSIYSLPGGTKQANISATHVESISILLPPLPEQKKIAAILSTWDRAIEETEKLLANSQQQKKAFMQQLLTGKKRLPGFTGEWVTKTFSDLFILKIGGTPARSNTAYWDIDKTTENRWVAISDLKSSKIRSTSEHISDLGAQNSNCSLIPKGTIILSFKLTIGKKAILLEDCYTNEAICALIIKDKKLADTRYIYQALDNVNYEEEIDQAVKGKTLNKEKLARLRMSVPPVPEQQAIAGVLTTADEEITAIESDLARLRQEKKALMQQLLTGKRRVKVD